jgi:hypothetical protein
MAADTGEQRRTGSVQITLVLPWGRSGAPALVAAVLAVVQTLWFAVELLRGYFWQDDYALLYLGGSTPLRDLLLWDYSGHLQPGMFVVCKVLDRAAPLNWPVAAMILVVLHAAAVFLLWRLLTRLFGQRWAILVPFVLITFSPPTFVMTMWWAYGMQLLPVQLALIGALSAHVAHLESPSRARVAQAVLWILFGLAFWEKAALIPLVLFGVTVALADGGPWTRLRSAVARHRVLWSLYLVLLVGYGALHQWRTPTTGSDALTAENVRGLISYMLGDALAPALLGGPWSGDWVGLRSLASPDAWVLVLTWTVVAAVVVAGVWFGRWRAGVAWLTLAVYVAVSVTLVALTRLNTLLGAIPGADRRYIADMQVVAVLLASVAVLRPRVGATVAAVGSAAGARLRSVWERAPTWVPVTALAVLVLGTVLSIMPALPYQRHTEGREYVANVRAVSAQEPDLVLYDSAVSPDFIHLLFGDYTQASRALYGLRLRYDEPSDDLRMLDGAGTPRAIGLVDTVGSREGPVEGCGHLLGAQVARVSLQGRAEGERLVAQVDYYTAQPWDGVITTPAQRIPVRFEAGLHRLSLVVDGPFGEVLVEADGPVCVSGVLVGRPLPHSG